MRDNFSNSQVIRKPAVVSKSGIVAAQHAKAAAVGANVLAAGGDCVDAVVATSFALGAVEPWMSGMGGGGIANVGRPDKSVTVHEFGHAFVGLLDEYANNPSAPQSPVKAPNVSMSPDPKEVPWAHFLEKKVPGVGVFLGGATFQKGVWRPAQGCAMNSAGHYGYCPVCRETAVLRIYSYVNPIDSYDPPTSSELSVKEGDDKSFLSVAPMKPKKHELTVTWYVERVATDAPGPQPAASGRTGEDPRERMRRGLSGHWSDGGKRAREERITYDIPPAGEPDNSGVMKKAEGNKPARAAFPIGHLKPGRYRVTVVVQDPSPWVLKDDKHLLEERLSWMVRVLPK